MEMKLRVNTKAKEQKRSDQFDEEILLEPVSPITEFFLTERVTLYVLAFFELENVVDFPSIYAFIKDFFLNSHPRFSSIPVEDNNKGKKMWERVEVNIKDHVKIPTFPEDLSTQDYDYHLDDYVSKIATSKIPQQKPLWQLHIFNYPTKSAASTIIIKFHHAIADGTSLMGLVFTGIQRADDPSLPLTFPSRNTSSQKMKNTSACHNIIKVLNIVPNFMSSIFHTFHDFGQSLRLLYSEDDITPIRSGNIEFHPFYKFCTVTLSLTGVKAIKTTLGVTVNDVVVGIIFLGIRLYMQEINHGKLKKSRSTVVITLNLRSAKGYARPEEMRKDDTKVPWGNRFSCIELPITNLDEDDLSNPLNFILKSHKVLKRKKNTPFAQVLLGGFFGAVRACAGLQAAARAFERRTTNSSFLMTNLIGPTEKMSFASHPVKGFYFIPTGVKSSLTVSVMSYMQMLTIGLAVEKDFIDYQKLITCVEKAFQLILQAATSTTSNYIAK